MPEPPGGGLLDEGLGRVRGDISASSAAKDANVGRDLDRLGVSGSSMKDGGGRDGARAGRAVSEGVLSGVLSCAFRRARRGVSGSSSSERPG